MQTSEPEGLQGPDWEGGAESSTSPQLIHFHGIFQGQLPGPASLQLECTARSRQATPSCSAQGFFTI